MPPAPSLEPAPSAGDAGVPDLAVHPDVRQHQVPDPLEHVVLGDPVEDTVHDPDVRDRAVGVAAQPKPMLALAAGHVPDLDVPERRGELAAVPFLVEEVRGHDRFGHLAHGHVAHVDVLDDAAADRVGLEAERPVEPGAVHAAALDEDVAGAARHLAADDDAAMAIFHLTVADDHILDWRRHPPAVVVPAGLEGDA